MNDSIPDIDANLRDLYQDVIFDHYRKPRHFGHLVHPDRVAQGHNPLCGDRIALELTLGDGDTIRDMAFSGEGCAISTASASLLTEAVIGMRIDEALILFGLMHDALVEGATLDSAAVGKLAALEGVKQFPARVKCAMLAWRTLHNALTQQADIASTEAEQRHE